MWQLKGYVSWLGHTSGGHYRESPNLACEDAATHGASADDFPGDGHRRVAEVRDSGQAATGKEVLDSDEDNDEAEDDKPSVETQTVLVSSSAPSIPSPNLHNTLKRTSDVINDQFKSPTCQPNDSDVQELFNIPRSSQRSKSTDQHSSQSFRIVQHAFIDPILSDQPTPSKPILHRTDSEQASAQLFGDLRRVTDQFSKQNPNSKELGTHTTQPIKKTQIMNLPTSSPRLITYRSSRHHR